MHWPPPPPPKIKVTLLEKSSKTVQSAIDTDHVAGKDMKVIT